VTDKMHIRHQRTRNITEFSKHRLNVLKVRLTDWIADIRRFYPWTALEQSVSQDLEAVWQEQKRRGAQKGKKS
jgi:hypothetical protein